MGPKLYLWSLIRIILFHNPIRYLLISTCGFELAAPGMDAIGSMSHHGNIKDERD